MDDDILAIRQAKLADLAEHCPGDYELPKLTSDERWVLVESNRADGSYWLTPGTTPGAALAMAEANEGAGVDWQPIMVVDLATNRRLGARARVVYELTVSPTLTAQP